MCSSRVAPLFVCARSRVPLGDAEPCGAPVAAPLPLGHRADELLRNATSSRGASSERSAEGLLAMDAFTGPVGLGGPPATRSSISCGGSAKVRDASAGGPSMDWLLAAFLGGMVVCWPCCCGDASAMGELVIHDGNSSRGEAVTSAGAFKPEGTELRCCH
jgi:hypothetical protein